MNNKITEGQVRMTPSHRAVATPAQGGRTKRVLGATALALVTAAAVVLPLQGAANAAPASVRGSVGAVHTAASALSTSAAGAKTGLATSARSGARYSRGVYEARLLVWANRVRHTHGVRPIAVRPCHDGYAERWTGYLVRNGEFRHQDLGSYMTRCKLTGAGEILALGNVSPAQMIRMWMNSPDHRHVLLDRAFGMSGIAARRDSNGNWIGCIDFGHR